MTSNVERGAQLIWPDRLLTGANSRQPDSSRERLQKALCEHDLNGEKLIAVSQIGIAAFILLLHVIAQAGHGWQSINPWVFSALTALIGSSLFRYYLVRNGRLAESILGKLTVFDISSALVLIASYQLAYDHPSGGSLKAPSFVILYALIALRTLRFSPWPILLSGGTAVLGWSLFVLLSIYLDGPQAITKSYTEYLTSYKILIGTEVEKVAIMIALTAVLATAAHQARKIIGRVAHQEEAANAALRLLETNEGKLRVQNERLNAVMEHMSHGIAMFDDKHQLVLCNKRYSEIHNLPIELSQENTCFTDIIEHRIRIQNYYGNKDEFRDSLTDLFKKNKKVSSINKMHDGRTISLVYSPLPDGGDLITHEDISEFQQIRDDFYHLAHHDPLTGLANRHMFGVQLEHAITHLKSDERLAVHLIDLDFFKNVNDSLGHPAGDKLLKNVSERLKQEVDDLDIVARMGGDEFAIIQLAFKRPEAAEDLADRIIANISRPYVIDGHQVIIGASVGISFCPDDGNEIETLMRNADLALYRAKAAGRGTRRFFEVGMDAKMQDRRKLDVDMRQAIELGELDLYYQPLISLDTNKLCGFEALLRWNHPERGLILPDKFIPLAEENGYVVRIGEWVIREACHMAASWPEPLIVAINLSPAQFRNDGLVELIANALSSSGLPPARLEIEITETVLLGDSDATVDMLNQIKHLGVRVAMDDFGTGYSSLSYLQKFPFDKIKIDRSFIQNLSKDGAAMNIVRAVASMANGMGIQTTAEGVETQQQLDLIRGEGYTQIQGFLISEPMPAGEISEKFHLEKKSTPAADIGTEPETQQAKLASRG
ncbi:MAG: EAL domain-containing protein [Hyphomicrobiales bacterium]|nr:EAL domain-containing protein [Hyphomicrobiales bacterium]